MDRRSFLSAIPPLLASHPLTRWGQRPLSPDLAGAPVAQEFRILLWDGDHVHSRPCFDVSGERIIFMRSPAGPDPTATANADASPWSLWSVGVEGGDPALLLEHPGMAATRPDVCRRTGRIAFTGVREGRGELWVVEPDGTGLTHIPVGDPPLSRIFYPSWYDDGVRVAVTDYEKHQVLSVSTQSGRVIPLTDPGQVLAGMGAVSSQAGPGGVVAFAGQVPGPSFDVGSNMIWLVGSDGSPRPLDGLPGRTPAWSGDGLRLAFNSSRSRPAPATLMRRRSLPAGGGAVFVASRAADEKAPWDCHLVTPLDHSAIHPKWSPSGQEIVLMVRSLETRRSGISVVES